MSTWLGVVLDVGGGHSALIDRRNYVGCLPLTDLKLPCAWHEGLHAFGDDVLKS